MAQEQVAQGCSESCEVNKPAAKNSEGTCEHEAMPRMSQLPLFTRPEQLHMFRWMDYRAQLMGDRHVGCNSSCWCW